jgi:hypothetical protein
MPQSTSEDAMLYAKNNTEVSATGVSQQKSKRSTSRMAIQIL